jgi:hypothetical protein
VPGNLCDTDRPELLPVSAREPGHAVRCHIKPAKRREVAAEALGDLVEGTA